MGGSKRQKHVDNFTTQRTWIATSLLSYQYPTNTPMLLSTWQTGRAMSPFCRALLGLNPPNTNTMHSENRRWKSSPSIQTLRVRAEINTKTTIVTPNKNKQKTENQWGIPFDASMRHKCFPVDTSFGLKVKLKSEVSTLTGRVEVYVQKRRVNK